MSSNTYNIFSFPFLTNAETNIIHKSLLSKMIGIFIIHQTIRQYQKLEKVSLY